MKLLPLRADALLTHPSLPFSVFSEDGRMLLSAHARLDDPAVRDKLHRLGTVHVLPGDQEAWERTLAGEVDGLLRANAPLSRLAQAHPALAKAAGPAAPGAEWDDVMLQLDRAMQSAGPDTSWLARVLEIHAHLGHLSARRMDEALFHLVYTGGCRSSFYSSRQALRCMLIAGEAARAMEWEAPRVALLEKAALTMNAAVWQLQDRLTQQAGAIDDPGERARIERHPADGARLLQTCGVKDTAWLEAVRLHHDVGLVHRPPRSLTPGQQMAQLLCRVDRYSAMLSRRARRQPLSALQAAQRACLGADGRPDLIGSVLLKAIGLYPPGTFVALASNESGVVLERGEHANTPVVAALTNRDGMAMAEPRLRYTTQKASAVRTALPYGRVPMEPPLDKLQALRIHLHSL